MKRTFITFTHGYKNNELTKFLKKSVDAFSEYDLKVYTEKDFDFPYDLNNSLFWKSGFGYITKIYACLKSLEEYDEVIWLDTDIVVTEKIDKIWDFTKELENYPLLPKNRFANYQEEPTKLDEVTAQSYVQDIVNFFNIENAEFTRFDYLQACAMVFNKNTTDFFYEVLTYFDNFDSTLSKVYDESIINGLIWKNNYKKNLGNIFLCSHYFHGNLRKVISLTDKERYPDVLNVKPIENNFDNLLFFHGAKTLIVVNNILSLLLKYKKTNYTDLGELMYMNGSDKSTKHNYTKIYSMLFDKFKNDEINIFELGIGTNDETIDWNMGNKGIPAASLHSWSEYFPKSKIYSADIDKNILINNDKIKSFYCNQLDILSIEDLWNNDELNNIEFDIMILDGYHSYDANMLFLTNSIHKLRVGGYLVVEDIHKNELEQYKNKFHDLEYWYPTFDISLFEPVKYHKEIDDNFLLIFYKKL